VIVDSSGELSIISNKAKARDLRMVRNPLLPEDISSLIFLYERYAATESMIIPNASSQGEKE
jgi:hypothetical protein